MKQYVLYLILKEICKTLNSNFKYSFNDMDSNAADVVGIYIKGGETSNIRTLAKGEYFNSINRVQFFMQGDISKDSLMSLLQFGSDIKNSLITMSNSFTQAPKGLKSDGSYGIGLDVNGNIVLEDKFNTTELTPLVLKISKVDMVGDLNSLGKSEQGRPRYSINFKITYEVGGN